MSIEQMNSLHSLRKNKVIVEQVNLLCQDLLDDEKFAFINKNMNGKIKTLFIFYPLQLAEHW